MKDNRALGEIFEEAFRQAEILGMLKELLKYDIDGNIVLKVGYKHPYYNKLKEWLDNDK